MNRARANADVAGRVAGSHTVTLITGDTVRLTTAAGGQRDLTVTPGPGRRGIAFPHYSGKGEVSVVPSDAAPLLAAGRLDATSRIAQ
jgi:hypothetical protein